jgi:hypothetical protein
MTDGSLVVEPVTTHAGNSFIMNIAKPQYNPCSLCGESRKDAKYLRNHRFRTSEQDSAQRYPLCRYCLVRVRSTCDFLSFLRMVKDGHWRADDDDQERAAWEESVRLREQMFWARIGGGVVPCSHSVVPAEMEKRPRPSQEASKPEEVPAEKPAEAELPPLPTREEQPSSSAESEEPAKATVEGEPSIPSENIEATKSIRNSAQSLTAQSDAGSEYSKRLSITIPSKE